MKVRDLKEAMKHEHDDDEVHFATNYGDYWRTEIAPAITSVTVGRVVYSEYHKMDRIIDDDEYNDPDKFNVSDRSKVRTVVILR